MSESSTKKAPIVADFLDDDAAVNGNALAGVVVPRTVIMNGTKYEGAVSLELFSSNHAINELDGELRVLAGNMSLVLTPRGARRLAFMLNFCADKADEYRRAQGIEDKANE